MHRPLEVHYFIEFNIGNFPTPGNGSEPAWTQLRIIIIVPAQRRNVEGYEDKYYSGRRPNGIYIPRFRNVGDDKQKNFVRDTDTRWREPHGWERGVSEMSFGADLKNSLTTRAGGRSASQDSENACLMSRTGSRLIRQEGHIWSSDAEHRC